VCAVEDAHLARAVGSQIVGPHHVEAGLVERKLVGEALRSLDHPQVKGFSGDQQGIGITKFGEQLVGFGRRIAWHDPVDQGIEKTVVLGNPIAERLRQRPVAGMAQHDLAQGGAVRFDQLAGQEYQSGIWLAASASKRSNSSAATWAESCAAIPRTNRAARDKRCLPRWCWKSRSAFSGRARRQRESRDLGTDRRRAPRSARPARPWWARPPARRASER